MSEETPPTYTTSIFNQANFNTSAGGIDTAYLNSHYLRYPTAQTGLETIANLATTNDATINGLTVGRGAGSVATNTALGDNALAANTTGANNVAIGTDALLKATTGSKSTAVGSNALTNNTIGTQNTAVGNSSLGGNSTGDDNTAVGHSCLFTNTASSNTAVGFEALGSNTSGSNNIAMGYRAGKAGTANTTGSNNTYIGYQAQADANNYSNSTAIGVGAIITASNQVVLGRDTETVVIPRITRFLSPPVFSRTNTANQTITNGVDNTVLFTSLLSGSSTYTGITYSAGTFTNSNSYSIAVNISCWVAYTANTTGLRSLYIQPSGGATRQSALYIPTVNSVTSPTCLNISLNWIMTAGSSFTVQTAQTSGGSLDLTNLGTGYSAISIMVF